MVYFDRATKVFCTSETASDHPISDTYTYIEVYVDNFIILAQGGPSDWSNAQNNIFHFIELFSG